jgi:hypothetical protein
MSCIIFFTKTGSLGTNIANKTLKRRDAVIMRCLTAASFALKVGELCQDPVESDSGYHAIVRIA